MTDKKIIRNPFPWIGKVFKYEMKHTVRILLPVLIAILAIAVILGLCVPVTSDGHLDLHFSFNIDGNENLADMLNGVDGLENKYLWFDFKNLSPQNKDVTFAMINKIVEENNLKKENIIIESKDATSLNIFAKAGYYTSLDLDCYSWKDINTMPNSLKENIKLLEQSNIDFVSSDLKFIDIVKYCFPNMPHLFWLDIGVRLSPEQNNRVFENDKNAYIVLN